MRRTAQANCQSTDSPRKFDATQNIGRSAASGDSDQRIRGLEAAPLEIAFRLVRIVLRPLDGIAQGRISAGNQRLHKLRWRIESRRTLRRIQHSQPPGSSGPDVKE